VANLGAALASRRTRVLLLDLDPQANLTGSLGIDPAENGGSLLHLLLGKAKPEEVVVKHNGLDIIPATLELSGVLDYFHDTAGKEFLLEEKLEDISRWDYLLIDCPPSLGLLTINALTLATELIIPLQTEYLALRGMRDLLQTIRLVQTRLNTRLELLGILGTRYDGRKRLSREVVNTINEYFRKRLFHTLIRENIALAEAPSHGKTIFEYRPRSHGAEDYLRLAQEIKRRKHAPS